MPSRTSIVDRRLNMPLVQITLSEPIPDLECLSCGEIHKYDDGGEWGECLVLKDTRFIPPQVACWCNEACFNKWLDSAEAKELFPTM